MKKVKNQKEIYGGALYEFKPTIRSMIRILISKIFYEKTYMKESIYDESIGFRPPANHIRDLPLQYIALVKDSVVKELIRIDHNTADVLLDPEVRMVTYDAEKTFVAKNMKYENDKFFIEKDIKNEKD